MVTYEEYLQKTNQKDCKTSFRWWCIDERGMTEKEATRQVYNDYVNNYENKRKAI